MDSDVTTLAPAIDDVTAAANASCSEVALEWDVFFTICYTAPAGAVCVLFFLCQPRTHLCLDRCWRRPGLAYPINFVDEQSRRWAFTIVFGLITYKIVLLFVGDFIYRPEEMNDAEWMKTYGWVKVFVGMLNILIIGLVYYPLLLALVWREHIFANVLGLLYTVPMVYNSTMALVICPIDKEQSFETILSLVLELPILAMWFLLSLVYIYDLVLNIRAQCCGHAVVDKEYVDPVSQLNTELCIIYLRGLLQRKPRQEPETFLGRMRKRFTYENTPGFQYSIRIPCTMIVAVVGLYQLASYVQGLITMLFSPIAVPLVEAVLQLLQDVDDMQRVLVIAREAIYAIEVCLTLGNVMSVVMHLVLIALMVLSFKNHTLKLYRGDRSWHFNTARISPASHMVAGMKYSGYQIAYIFWGYFLMFAVLVLLFSFISIALVLPLKLGYPSFVIDKIKELWPAIVVSMAIALSQMLLAKCCFLQNRGAYLALNNRRFFHIASFFLFFFNTLVGLFACLKRVLFSIMFGTALMCRLDKPLLSRQFERFDMGYKAYLGMLEVDMAHNHPVMKAFLLLLQDEVARRPPCEVIANGHTQAEKPYLALKEPRRSRQWVNKWRKAVTLINNPFLLVDQIHEKVKDNRKNYDSAIADEVLDQMANVGTVMVGAGVASAASAVSTDM